MDFHELISVLSRWIHVVAGILWIGLLYFFNFVNIPFAGTLDADVKRKVVPELLPRALYWFRWAAAFTWITGVILVIMVFYVSRELMFGEQEWGTLSYILIALVFLMFPIYDVLAKSSLGKDIRVFGLIGFILVGVLVYLMHEVAGFSYRAYNIHIGVLFGTLMAANVWMRIWPSQKKIITAVKTGETPDPNIATLAATRSRHNTYMSVPLVWTMINMHTTTTFVVFNWLYFMGVILIGWLVVSWLYSKSTNVKGF